MKGNKRRTMGTKWTYFQCVSVCFVCACQCECVRVRACGSASRWFSPLMLFFVHQSEKRVELASTSSPSDIMDCVAVHYLLLLRYYRDGFVVLLRLPGLFHTCCRGPHSRHRSIWLRIHEPGWPKCARTWPNGKQHPPHPWSAASITLGL